MGWERLAGRGRRTPVRVVVACTIIINLTIEVDLWRSLWPAGGLARETKVFSLTTPLPRVFIIIIC